MAGLTCTFIVGLTFTAESQQAEYPPGQFPPSTGMPLILCATDGWDADTFASEVQAADSAFLTWTPPVVFNQAFLDNAE